MLSKVLQYARNILTTRTPALRKDPETETKTLSTAMVTTRQQSGSNSDPSTDVSLALESLSQDTHTAGSRKHRLHQDTDEPDSHAGQDDSTHASARKRQKLPVREKDEQDFEKNIHIAVEIPVRDITQDGTPMWTAPEQRKANRERSLAEDTSSNLDRQGKHKRKDEEFGEDQNLNSVAQKSVNEVTSLHEMTEKGPEKKERRKKGASKHSGTKIPSPMPVKSAIGSNVTKPKHKRFDSAEPAAEEINQEDEEGEAKVEGDDSSDDDAPEVIATHDAQEKATVTARNAAKAVEEQDALIRRKRKERDAQLKEQAKAANKKRKRTGDSVEGHANEKSLDFIDNLGENESQEDPSGSASWDSKDPSNSSKPRTIITKHNIPEFLPEEYLEDDPLEDQDPILSIKDIVVHKSKKIKFVDPAPKKIKDRRKGSTVYRVAEAPGDGLLAPKAAINARAVKEAWLNGQRGAGRSMKVVKGGFFKNRK